jgi:hypothetical protein
MRAYAELERDAADSPPFSNGTEGYAWMDNWCARCKVDAPARKGDEGNGCPLILLALIGKTPAEWFRQDGNYLGDKYHCVEFRDEDEPDGNPHPERPIPGQGELIPRAPFERPKVFADTAAEFRKVAAP